MKVSNNFATKHSEDEFSSRLRLLSDAGSAIIHVRTSEISRAVMAARKSILLQGAEYIEWSVVDGLTPYTLSDMMKPDVVGDQSDFMSALSAPMEVFLSEGETVVEPYLFYVFINPQYWLSDNPPAVHFIERYSDLLPSSRIRIVLVTPDAPLPDAINDLIVTLPFDPPAHTELKEYLHGIVDPINEDKVIVDLSEDDYDRICYAGAGLSKSNFEMHSSLAIVEAAQNKDEGDDTITVDEVISGINEGKAEILRQSNVLSLYQSDDIGNVGGLDNLKNWIKDRKDCFSDEAREFGIEAPKGILLTGVSGCLSGDTEILINRGNRPGGRLYSLREIYYMYNNKIEDGRSVGALKPHRKGWDLSIQTRTLSFVEGHDRFLYNTIEGVLYSGEKKVYEVETGLGNTIKATSDHEFLTEKGYAPLSKLQVGDVLYMRKYGDNVHDYSVWRESVLSITCVGTEPTYDIQMASPYNNFVGNNFVVHNCGKTKLASTIANEFGVPLIKFDLSSIFSSLVGSTEQNLKRALRDLEAIAPCVAILDEIERASASGNSSGDSGVSSRALGNLLTWMQDNKAPVFIVATSNNSDKLPPELTRRGRLDGIFGVDLPNPTEREEIFWIHLRKRGREKDINDRDMITLVKESKGYTGAEIEACIKDALVSAFAAKEKLTVKHVLSAIEVLVPLSVTYSDQVKESTKWMANHAIPASSEYVKNPVKRVTRSRRRTKLDS